MAEGKRPGGLTALAVLNFVFGGISLLLLIGGFALLGLAKTGTDALENELNKDPEMAKLMEESEDGKELQEAMGEVDKAFGLVAIYLLIGTVITALLITSGIGYIGQKKMLGLKMGMAYGIASILGTVFNLATGFSEFGIMTIIFMIYPVLTLILLSTTFKEDFVNP